MENQDHTNQTETVQNIYPDATKGPLSEPAPQKMPNNTIILETKDDLGRYLRKQISRRIVVSIIGLLLSIPLALYVIRDPFLFINSGTQPSMLELAFVLIILAIPLYMIITLFINLLNIRKVHSYYKFFNRLVYIPVWRLIGLFTAGMAVFSFLNFLNPFAWIIQPDKQYEYLVSGAIAGGESYMSFKEAANAEELQPLLELYFTSE